MKDINHLREQLFETLAALRDKEHPMDLDRAKTVANVAQVIVDSARVEVEMARVTGGRIGSDFLPQPALPGPTALANGQPQLVKGYAHK